MQRREFLKSSLALAALAGLARVSRAEPAPAGPNIAEGNNAFGWELFGQLRAQEGNLFCSPFSISTALAMTSVGARGRTAEQMSQMLHLPADAARAHQAYGALLKQLNAVDPKRGYQLSVANALWGQKGYKWKQSFLAATKEAYGAGLNELDFSGDTETARRTINAWVEKETRDKIRELLQRGVLDSDTRLVLTNAIYFKGDWADKFDKKSTFDEPFHMSEQKQAKVPMMHRTGKCGYAENEQVKILSLPYKGKELSMLFLLPRKQGGLSVVEKAATPAAVERWIKGVSDTEVVVALPKFKMTSQFGLVPPLKELGMTEAFTPWADFSGMSDEERLFVSDVIHKAFVEVNEEGAEAAAATAVMVKAVSAQVNPKPVPVFRADHPFLFLIRDNKSGAILFLGRLADPR